MLRLQGRITEAVGDNLAAFNLPERDSSTPAKLLNLSAHFNGSPKEAWHNALADRTAGGRNLAVLPLGRTNLLGTDFDIRGVVQLRGVTPQRWYDNHPERIDGIRVGQACRHLHFLHATRGLASDGIPIGSYEIRYVDGEQHSVPIRYGPDLRHWERDDKTDRNTGAVVAWTGTNASGTAVRLFKSTWENPRPNVSIQSIDFVSANTPAALFLLAITADP